MKRAASPPPAPERAPVDSPRFVREGRTFPLLSWTSAMSAYSWSLPAGKAGACPAEFQGPGTICAGCYAQQGRYGDDVVRGAQWARFDWLREDPESCMEAVGDAIAHVRKAARRKGIDVAYFRVHDSGDFHERESIGRWYDLAARFPRIAFWFPTRVYRFPAWIPELRRLAELPNVTVRPSALRFGETPPIIPGLDAGTTSHDDPMPNVRTCPKSDDGTSCGAVRCRTCWTRPDATVNYLRHGHILSERERTRNSVPVPLTLAGSAIGGVR